MRRKTVPQEIEVTPEMIQAAASIILDRLDLEGCLRLSSAIEAQDLVEEILKAAVRSNSVR